MSVAFQFRILCLPFFCRKTIDHMKHGSVRCAIVLFKLIRASILLDERLKPARNMSRNT